MPTYEYACRSCGERLEVVQSFADPPLTSCGSCGGSLRKVFGAVGIVFKGSGFYKTDSRSNGATKEKAGASEQARSDSASKEAPAPATSNAAAGASAAASSS